MDMKGLAAVVTGGASGLGGATARALVNAGMKVAIIDVDASRGEAHAAAIGASFFRADVTSGDEIHGTLEAAEAVHGPVRVLVNCAGIGPAAKTVSRGEPHPYDLFRKVIGINLVGTFNCIRLAAARMVAAEPIGEERGVIVNTASVAAFDGQIGQAAYSASKGGIVGMTLPVARDLADKLIRCVTIAPGIFATPLVSGLPEAVRESLAKSVPHPHRLGKPEEYAALVRHIVENPMLNGETIRLDGAIRMAPR